MPYQAKQQGETNATSTSTNSSSTTSSVTETELSPTKMSTLVDHGADLLLSLTKGITNTTPKKEQTKSVTPIEGIQIAGNNHRLYHSPIKTSSVSASKVVNQTDAGGKTTTTTMPSWTPTATQYGNPPVFHASFGKRPSSADDNNNIEREQQQAPTTKRARNNSKSNNNNKSEKDSEKQQKQQQQRILISPSSSNEKEDTEKVAVNNNNNNATWGQQQQQPPYWHHHIPPPPLGYHHHPPPMPQSYNPYAGGYHHHHPTPYWGYPPTATTTGGPTGVAAAYPYPPSAASTILPPAIKETNNNAIAGKHEVDWKNAENLNRCVPIKNPVPNRFWGNNPMVQEHKLPEFSHIVNFPDFLARGRSDKTQSVDGKKHCVMCGKLRVCSSAATSNNSMQQRNNGSNNRNNNNENNDNNSTTTTHIIPRQNKGVCTVCDVAVWMMLEDNIEIKWCKGCKNFRPWIAFGEKGHATKCLRCRNRQKEKYANQKNENIHRMF